MAEPEDLIIDGAYVATRLARTIWQRHLAPASAGVRLASVRLRLELFVQAIFGRSITIAAAPPPTPVSWLARLAGRAPAPDPDVEAGSDGVRVYLPSMLAVPAGKEIETYLLLAVQQAARVVRGSAVAATAIGDDQTRDWFGLADGIAIDRWMAAMTPGLLQNLQDARAEALSRRTRFSPTVTQRPVEERLCALLKRHPLTPPDDLPFDGGAQDAVRWARSRRGVQTSGTYRRIPPVWYWGRAVSISEGASRPEGGRPEETPAQHVASAGRRDGTAASRTGRRRRRGRRRKRYLDHSGGRAAGDRRRPARPAAARRPGRPRGSRGARRRSVGPS